MEIGTCYIPEAHAVGIGTAVCLLFVLQPAPGLGMESSQTTNRTKARAKSLATHTVFGIGFYLSAPGVPPLVKALTG